MQFFNLKSRRQNLLLGLGYFILIGFLTIILGQDVSWDLRNYHFYNPYMLLEGRIKYDILPAQIQTFFNPLIDVPFFVAIHYLHIPPIIVGFFLGGVHGLNIWLVHNLSYFSFFKFSEKPRRVLSALVAFTSLWGAAYLSELGTTIGDSTSSLFVLGGLLVITYQLSTQGKITLKNLIIAGLIVGLGVGLKLTTAIYGLALIFTVNVIGNNLKEKIIYTFSVGSSMFAGFLLIAGYWIMLMWTNFRNPLFPFFNKVFKSPYIETEESLKDLRFLPRDIWQTLFYPFHFLTNPNLVAEVKFRDIRLALAYLLIVILIATFIYRLWQGKTAKANPLINQSVFSLLIAFYVVSYIIWQSQFSIYRYLIVLELLTPVLIVFIISYLYPVEKKILLISFFLFVLIMTTVKPMDWWRISWSSDYFGIDRNSLIKYNNSVIVMSGDHPTSYLVPHFPTTTRFVRVTGNAGLSLNTLMRKNAEEIIRNTPENSLYILEIDLAGVDLEKQQRQQTEALSRMDLKVNDATCQPLSTLVGEYRICQLHRGQ